MAKIGVIALINEIQVKIRLFAKAQFSDLYKSFNKATDICVTLFLRMLTSYSSNKVSYDQSNKNCLCDLTVGYHHKVLPRKLMELIIITYTNYLIK